MADFVPESFDVPQGLQHELFRLEPLGPEHNQRDFDAWASSIEHIWNTPGFPSHGWPKPMTPEENLVDLAGHATDFKNRTGFTYSVLDGDVVIGCVYIYPSDLDGVEASVRSWVTHTRSELDVPLWEAVTKWLQEAWPFKTVAYDSRA